jgi:hypothetical protein
VQARALLFGIVLAVAGATSCALFRGHSKVAQGQLYQSGDGNYDPYFQSVHQQQTAAAAWPDEKKAARKPLVTALAAKPTASDESLVRETRSRAKEGKLDGAINAAIEETKRAETDRAARLEAASRKLEQLAKEGHQLEDEAKKEYENRGAEKADEKKSEKKRELRHELSAAVDVVESLAKDAKSDAEDAEEFVADLAVAQGKAPPKEPKEKPSDTSPAPPRKPEPAAPAASTKRRPAKPRPPEPPSEKPEKPAKPAKPPDEVFNP